MNIDFDVAIIGAGIVGLACAAKVAQKGFSTIIIETEGKPGTGTSARNSSVLHSGIYYPPNSLKARLCLRGNQLTYQYCRENNVPFKQTGKLIVASSENQIPILMDLSQNGVRNGVEGIKLLENEQVKEIEPGIRAKAALFVPTSGIVDSAALVWSLLAKAEFYGATYAPKHKVKKVNIGSDYVDLLSNDGEVVKSRTWINASGHSALEIFERTFSIKKYKSIPYAKGNYFYVHGARNLLSHLVYPLPKPGGLGVHITMNLAGEIMIGPDVEWTDTFDFAVNSARGRSLASEVATYYPAITKHVITPAYAGIRPKIFFPDGNEATDFIIETFPNDAASGMHLLGIESPGLTAALAIAEHVSDHIKAVF